MASLIALLVALLTGLFGGTVDRADGPPFPPPAWTVGTLVAGWGEDRFDRSDLGELPPTDAPWLIETEAQRAQFLAGLGEGLDTTAIEATDLETQALVVTAFHRCTESGALYTDYSEDVWFAVRTGDESVNCSWAPAQLQVWALDRSDFHGGAPEIVGNPWSEGTQG